MEGETHALSPLADWHRTATREQALQRNVAELDDCERGWIEKRQCDGVKQPQGACMFHIGCCGNRGVRGGSDAGRASNVALSALIATGGRIIRLLLVLHIAVLIEDSCRLGHGLGHILRRHMQTRHHG